MGLGTTAGSNNEHQGISRRSLLKAGLAVGAVGVAGLGGYLLFRTLQAPPPFRGRPDSFVYVTPTGAQLPAWWVEGDLVGREARLSHFSANQGANVLWLALRDEEGDPITDQGLPALLMRMDPEALEFPAGYVRARFVVEGLYAVFNCCTHACCRPTWQLSPRELQPDNPGYDTLYCPCHDGHFHPSVVEEYVHPEPPQASGARYVGVKSVAGPVPRGMPLIPLEVVEDVVLGRMEDPAWYAYLDFRSLAQAEGA